MSALIVLAGCATKPQAPTNLHVKQPTNFKFSLVDACGSEQKAVSDKFEGWDPVITQMSYVLNNVGHVKIFSGLSVSDTTRLWNDLTIFHASGIDEVELFLNSPGGSAFDGIAMARHLLNFISKGMTIRIHASGIVASAAIPILASGSERYALRGTIFMVHEAALWKWPGRETASDIRSQANLMNLLRDSYMDIMAETTTTSQSDWDDMEGNTTWFDVDIAKSLGLIDHIE